MFLKKWLRSFRHALRGLVFIAKHERNFQIECLIACFALGMAMVIGLSALEWILLLCVIGWVLAFEIINTVVERILDIIKPNVHPYVRVVKDMSAGAVLLAAIVAVLVGMYIFIPHLRLQ